MISVASAIHSAKTTEKKNQINQNNTNSLSKSQSQNIHKVQGIKSVNTNDKSKQNNIKSSIFIPNNHSQMNKIYHLYKMGEYHQFHHCQIYDIPSPTLFYGNQFGYNV